jgi:predicted SAM-dependent methyltransferase
MAGGDVCLELGAGAKAGRGTWLTVDMNGQCDIYCDLTRGIPFPAESVSRIYSSHFFEHLTPEEATACVGECLRVLKRGGEFSIAVPNARVYLDAYLSGAPVQVDVGAKTPLDYLRFVAYCGGGHKNMFDGDSLLEFLRSGGLKNVSLRGFDRELDLEVRDWETIYAVGYKG